MKYKTAEICKSCKSSTFLLLKNVYSETIIKKEHFEIVCENCGVAHSVLNSENILK